MRSKHEQAQALFDALDQVDEGFLRQACGTDTPEKFRALGKAKPISGSKKERPVTFLQHWGAFAACLAVALALAASPWFFARVLPALIDPTEPTQPPEPTTTIQPTEDTDPYAPSPNLYISDGSETIQAHSVGGHWDNYYFDAWPTPNFLESGKMPWLYTDSQAIVEFDIPPDQVEVTCWSIEYYIRSDSRDNDQECAIVDGQLALRPGTYIYEVNAKWNSGNYDGYMTYLFTITSLSEPPVCDYEFEEVNQNFLWPSMQYDKVNKDALKTTTEDGTFYSFTDSETDASAFIDSQRQLLSFLQDNGMRTGGLTYYAVDYGDSFSRSDDKEAYIDWSAIRTWKQILVTLQAILGDYADYGYVYATANAIALNLRWEIDPTVDLKAPVPDEFFKENPDALQLLYPSFTTEYASEETVANSKLISWILLTDLNWKSSLGDSLDSQLFYFSWAIERYAKDIGISYTEQSIGYAYGSQRIPLRIKTEFAEHFIDAGFVDSSPFFEDYFSDYAAIYETAAKLNDGESAIITSMNWDQVFGWFGSGPLNIYWLSEESASFKSVKTVKYVRYNDSGIVYARSLQYYMYGTAKYIERCALGRNRTQWQSQAFCELMRSQSWFAKYTYDVAFTQYEEEMQLFYTFTGRAYDPEGNDFYEVMDILCYINDAYDPSASQLAAASSVAGYLMRHYGEEQAFQFLLHPDTFQTETGMTWEELLAQWKQSIQEKYADIVWQSST